MKVTGQKCSICGDKAVHYSCNFTCYDHYAESRYRYSDYRNIVKNRIVDTVSLSDKLNKNWDLDEDDDASEVCDYTDEVYEETLEEATIQCLVKGELCELEDNEYDEAKEKPELVIDNMDELKETLRLFKKKTLLELYDLKISRLQKEMRKLMRMEANVQKSY